MGRDFRLLDVARAVTDEVHELLRTARPPLLHRSQLEKSAESIVGNIGEAGETKAHLRSNQVAKRLRDSQFWRLYNRLEVIRKMISRIIGD